MAANTVDNTLLGAVDWLPTVASIANVTLPAGFAQTLDGQDMSAAIVRLNDDNADANAKANANAKAKPNATVVRPPMARDTRPYLFWEWRFGQAGR